MKYTKSTCSLLGLVGVLVLEVVMLRHIALSEIDLLPAAIKRGIDFATRHATPLAAGLSALGFIQNLQSIKTFPQLYFGCGVGVAISYAPAFEWHFSQLNTEWAYRQYLADRFSTCTCLVIAFLIPLTARFVSGSVLADNPAFTSTTPLRKKMLTLGELVVLFLYVSIWISATVHLSDFQSIHVIYRQVARAIFTCSSISVTSWFVLCALSKETNRRLVLIDICGLILILLTFISTIVVHCDSTIRFYEGLTYLQYLMRIFATFFVNAMCVATLTAGLHWLGFRMQCGALTPGSH